MALLLAKQTPFDYAQCSALTMWVYTAYELLHVCVGMDNSWVH